MAANILYSTQNIDLANDSKIASAASKGSVGSRTLANGTSAAQPIQKGVGTNAKLAPWATTVYFDGGDSLDLNTAEEFNKNENWFMVFAFVDLDTTTDCILYYSSDSGGYIGIKAGGDGLVVRDNNGSASEVDVPTNNTDDSSISYSFGTDVEVLMVQHAADSNSLTFYNIDGALIAAPGDRLAATFNLDRIGANSSTSTEFKGQLIECAFYNGSDAPTTSAHRVAVGNYYKQWKN